MNEYIDVSLDLGSLRTMKWLREKYRNYDKFLNKKLESTWISLFWTSNGENKLLKVFAPDLFEWIFWMQSCVVLEKK